MEIVFSLGTGFVISPSFFLHGVVWWDAFCICIGAWVQMLGVAVVLYLSVANILARVAFPPKVSKVIIRLCAVGLVAMFGCAWRDLLVIAVWHGFVASVLGGPKIRSCDGSALVRCASASFVAESVSVGLNRVWVTVAVLLFASC